MARQVRGWRARGAPGHSDAKQRSQLGLQRPWDAYYVPDAELDALQERGGAPGLAHDCCCAEQCAWRCAAESPMYTCRYVLNKPTSNFLRMIGTV